MSHVATVVRAHAGTHVPAARGGAARPRLPRAFEVNRRLSDEAGLAAAVPAPECNATVSLSECGVAVSHAECYVAASAMQHDVAVSSVSMQFSTIASSVVACWPKPKPKCINVYFWGCYYHQHTPAPLPGWGTVARAATLYLVPVQNYTWHAPLLGRPSGALRPAASAAPPQHINIDRRPAAEIHDSVDSVPGASRR